MGGWWTGGWIKTCFNITNIDNTPELTEDRVAIVLSNFFETPDGIGLVIGGFVSAMVKVTWRIAIIPSVIPKALVVLSISFKLLFNCLTNLFFLLIYFYIDNLSLDMPLSK